MLILFHKNNKVVEVVDQKYNTVITCLDDTPLKVMFSLASSHGNRIIAWCHVSSRNNINAEAIKSCFTTTNVMVSSSFSSYFGGAIGYVEDSPFININKKVKYPTWLMNSQCGAIYGETLLLFKNHISHNKSFDYNLNSIAKLGMSNGLYCYFSPDILNKNRAGSNEIQAKNLELFQFVKQHYKTRWVFLLFLNMLLFDKKLPVVALIKSLFYKQKQFNNTIVTDISNPKLKAKTTISVLIPTLGRSKYLYDVLQDLAKQSFLPNEVIIIEQDDSPVMTTALNYLETESWPFKIVHKLIGQTGACNARNIGLKEISSSYVFMADDDIRFDIDTLYNALQFMESQSQSAVTLSCLRENDVESKKTPIQWSAFGSGCSIVKTDAIKTINFDLAFEHGFGEDSDFGMQLRNKGVDVMYLPSVQLKHLKAPIGGFRTKYIHAWENQSVAPKPSPTVMLYNLKYKTRQQVNSYKLTLFFKFYNRQPIKQPFKYYRVFKERWALSQAWANKLQNKTI